MERVALEVRKVVLSDEWWGETSGYEPAVPLFNSLARFRRNGAATRAQPGLTLFFAHANGFNKEVGYFCLSCARSTLAYIPRPGTRRFNI